MGGVSFKPYRGLINIDFSLGNTGSILNVGTPGNDWTTTQLGLDSANTGGDIKVRASNADNSDTTSRAVLQASIGGTSGGDPVILFDIAGGEIVTMGLDNSVSDNWTVSDNNGLGTNDRMRLAITTGVLSVDGDGGGADDPVLLFDTYDDALELRGFQLAGVEDGDYRERLVELGVAEWADQEDGSRHMMIRLQPMLRLLAGGIFQNRQLIEATQLALTKSPR